MAGAHAAHAQRRPKPCVPGALPRITWDSGDWSVRMAHIRRIRRESRQRRIEGPLPKGRPGSSPPGFIRSKPKTSRAERSATNRPLRKTILVLSPFPHQTVETGKSPAFRAPLLLIGGDADDHPARGAIAGRRRLTGGGRCVIAPQRSAGAARTSERLFRIAIRRYFGAANCGKT